MHPVKILKYAKKFSLISWKENTFNSKLLYNPKVNDLVTLTVTFLLKKKHFLDFVADRGMVSHKHILLFTIALDFFNTFSYYSFYAPRSNDWGHIVFVMSVCPSVCCQL